MIMFELCEEKYNLLYKAYKEQDKEIERLSKEVTKYDEILCERNDEVDRLNNIINELEKWLEENDKQLCLRKLKALKEGK